MSVAPPLNDVIKWNGPNSFERERERERESQSWAKVT